MHSNRIKRVALAFRMSFASHRDIIYGISQYAKAHHWQLVFASAADAHAENDLKMTVPADIDGFISCEGISKSLKAFAPGSSHPAVILCQHESPSSRPTTRPMGLVSMDDKAIGAYGADYLLSLGRFRAFGFVPENLRHSSLRGRGFVGALRKAGVKPSYYPAQSAKSGSEEDKRTLAEWLDSLPKPAAVMADYDLRASQVLEAAHVARIAVPEQLSVLGVDNDEILCDFTDPPLSSIAPDFVQIGELAARTLARLMRCKTPRTIRAQSDSKRIVERESTKHIAPSVQLVERALDYIRHNALSGISAHDVVTFLGVSRRLADQRFREVTGQSILEAILARRLEAVQRKLLTSRQTIRAITATCGFRSENYAKNLFRKRFGLSMREFRQSKTQKSP